MTPQVYPTVWNEQGAVPGQSPSGVVWNPQAPAPGPIAANIHDPTENMIVKDQANPGKTPLETELDKVQQHNNVAANLLCQKNRKRKQSSFELPFDLTIEEGITANLQGFAANFDGKWLITEVNYGFSGKAGSRFSIELQQCLAPPVKTPGGAPGKAITVPRQPSARSSLLHDGGINSITPQPANVAELTLSGNETAPTWLNAGGRLNNQQQDLGLANVGPAG